MSTSQSKAVQQKASKAQDSKRAPDDPFRDDSDDGGEGVEIDMGMDLCVVGKKIDVNRLEQQEKAESKLSGAAAGKQQQQQVVVMVYDNAEESLDDEKEKVAK